MTATRELSWTHENIEGSVDAHIHVADGEGVYFTDQEPKFEITIENNTLNDIDNDSHVAWIIAIGQGRPEPFVTKQYTNFAIPAGDEREIEVSGEPLSLEGHGIVALGQGMFHNPKPDDESLRFTAGRTGKESYEPLATFSVWDREHYEVVHEQPQRAQQFALFASVGIVFFAMVQSGDILGYSVIGLIGGIILLIIYWYSGFLEEFVETLQEASS